MECRTSLFTTVAVDDSQCSLVSPLQTNDRRGYNRRNANRRVRDARNEAMLQLEHHQNDKPSQGVKLKKERLPLPKNAVLLSLMEATEFTCENAKMASQISPSKDETDKLDIEEMIQNEEEEEQRILQNLSVVTSACGTYAVASKVSLKIFPKRPNKNSSNSRSHSLSPRKDADSTRFHRVMSNIDREVESLVKATNNTPTRKSRRYNNPEGGLLQSRSESFESADCMTLNYGDRVQVVSINDGWAKLARGYGFVYCKNGTELVKVGNAADKACRIEAILHNIALQRSKLKREQDQLGNESVKLMNMFQNHLMNDDDITVIDASSFSSFSIPILKENEPNTLKTSEQSTTFAKAKSAPILKSESPPRQARSDSNDSRGYNILNISPSSIFSRFSSENTENDENRSPDTVQQTPSPVINPTLLAGAREWRRKNDKNAARGINFRTGMSGHMGVHSTYTHPHDYLYDNFRKMSAHSGLTVRTRKPN